LPRRFPAATREAAPKNEAGKGKNEEFQLSLRIAGLFLSLPVTFSTLSGISKQS
jgi:hypothetical protein